MKQKLGLLHNELKKLQEMKDSHRGWKQNQVQTHVRMCKFRQIVRRMVVQDAGGCRAGAPCKLQTPSALSKAVVLCGDLVDALTLRLISTAPR